MTTAHRAPGSPWTLPLGAAVLTLVARLPFLCRYLWDHDSVQFALAMERFDLAAHQPHPPGYPVYVALADALTTLGLGPTAAMEALSVLAAAAGASALAALVRGLAAESMESSRESTAEAAGWLAAVLYALNPILWFYGELPLVYAVEGGMTAVVAWAAHRAGRGRGGLVPLALVLALAGGLRPSSLALLAPLGVWAVVARWRRGLLDLRSFGLATAAGAAAVAAWALPLAVAAGGVAEYRRLSTEHFDTLLPTTSVLHGAGFDALAHNGFLVAKWAAQGLVPAILAVATAWLLVPRSIPTALRLLRRHGLFLAVWAVPPMAFFALFHVTKAGYTLIHLPALLTATALLGVPALSPAPDRERRGGLAVIPAKVVAVMAVAALAGAGLFLLGQDRGPEQSRAWALVRHEFNRQTLADYERDLATTLETLSTLPPEGTALVTLELVGSGAAGSEGFLYPWHRHLQWYLPELPVIYLVPEVARAERSPGDHQPFAPVPWSAAVPAGTQRLVWVLAGSTDDRYPLPPGEDHRIGERFVLRATAPVIPPLVLTSAPPDS